MSVSAKEEITDKWVERVGEKPRELRLAFMRGQIDTDPLAFDMAVARPLMFVLAVAVEVLAVRSDSRAFDAISLSLCSQTCAQCQQHPSIAWASKKLESSTDRAGFIERPSFPLSSELSAAQSTWLSQFRYESSESIDGQKRLISGHRNTSGSPYFGCALPRHFAPVFVFRTARGQKSRRMPQCPRRCFSGRFLAFTYSGLASGTIPPRI